MLIDLLPVAAYCFAISSTPGSNNLMLVNTAANFGYRASIPQLLGSQCGAAAHTFITCLGLGNILVIFHALQDTLYILGALYLIYLAYQVSREPLGKAKTAPPLSFNQAALFQVVNPRSWMKAITLATVFMPNDLSVIMGALWITLIGLVIGLPTKLVWAGFGVIVRGFLSKPLYLRIFNFMISATLIMLALHFFNQGSHLGDYIQNL